jgi:hypothetical protein
MNHCISNGRPHRVVLEANAVQAARAPSADKTAA